MEISQVLEALRNADAAGDKEAARRLAEIAQQMVGGGVTPPEVKPKEGVGAAVAKGIESLISSGKTAVGAFTGSPEEAAKAGLERGQDIGTRYADQVSLDKVKKAYEERGILPAAGEALSQIPAAIAEQLPNIGATIGGARAGAALGSLAGPVGSVVGGVAGAALPSLIQQFGGNIERQAKEGTPINRGTAAAAAIPQAALDVAGTFIPLGGRLVSKLTGIPTEALLGRSAAQVSKLADERLLATLAKGTAVGAMAEIPTEIAQQMLERAQAGLSLTDADAMKEYGETAYQAGLLAPMGAAGRLSDRYAARSERQATQAAASQEEQMRLLQEQEAEEDKAQLAKEQAAAMKQAKATGTPALLAQMGDTTVAGKYSELPDVERQRMDTLSDIAKNMGYKDEDLAGKTFAEMHQFVRSRAQDDLAQTSRVVPDLQKQTQEAMGKQDMPRVIALSKQLESLAPAEEQLKNTLKQLDKLLPKEVNPATVRTALQKALDNGDFGKAQTLAAQLDELQKTQASEQRTVPGETLPRGVRAMPTEQEDMFAPGFEERWKKEDIAEAQTRGATANAQPGVDTEAQKKAAAQQTALFESQQEYETTIGKKEEGKKKTLTPEEYLDALRRGVDPDYVGPEAPASKAAPKVLYREVPKERAPTDVKTLLSTPAAGKLPTGPTVRIPYTVDEKGVSRDLTDKEAAALETQTPKVAKSAVDEAIDSGVVNADVRDVLGIKGVGSKTLDLSNAQHAAVVETKVRERLADSKKQSQDLLDEFIRNPLAENNLYDSDGQLNDKAKEVLWRDMQAQELERLLRHITQRREETRVTGREEALVEQLATVPTERGAVDTTLAPIEKLQAKDANLLAQAMGVSGVADLQTVDTESVSRMRHTLEAKRQKEAKDNAYNDLLEALENQRKGQTPHKYDAVYFGKLRADYVEAALKEAAHLRATERKTPLSSANVLEASNEMHTALKELSTRYAAKPITEMVVGRVNKLSQMQDELAQLPEGPKREALQEKFNKALEKQNRPTLNRIKAKQEESARLRNEMERYRREHLEPERQKWQTMPEGALGSKEHAAREQMQQRYLLRKKKFDDYNTRDSKITQEITALMQRLEEPRTARAKFEKDIRPLGERPFADRNKAVESIKEQLDAATAKLGAPAQRKRVATKQLDMERGQALLLQIKDKQEQLSVLKNQHGGKEARENLINEIEALQTRYDKQQKNLDERQKIEPVPVAFKERRDEAVALESQIKEAFATKDYNTVAKLSARLQQVELGEDLASALGTDLEYNQRVLDRAIKETQTALDALVGVAPGKEVKLGEKAPPRRGLSEQQTQQLKLLTKRMDALQKSSAQNKTSLADIGLFAVKGADTTTEDLFAPSAEQGAIFDTPEQFLGSSKYGKIAKLRKEAERIASLLPVNIDDLQKARTNYVVAAAALQNLRKQPTATHFNYYSELAGQYAIQAEKMRKKAEIAYASSDKTARAFWTRYDAQATQLKGRAELYEKMADNAQLLDISKYPEDVQQIVVEAKILAPEAAEGRETGLAMAQENVDRLKKIMEDMDETARKQGVIRSKAEEKPADIPKGSTLDTRIGEVNAQIRLARERAAKQDPAERTQTAYEIIDLLQQRGDLETEQFMRTAEGRLIQLRESFMEEYSAEMDPVEPLKNALGRAIARSREYIPAAAQQSVADIERLRTERGTVVDALAKMAKAAAPTNKPAFIAFNEDLYDLREKLTTIDDNIAQLEERISEAQDGEVQMLRRADSALKDAWSKLKTAEKSLNYQDQNKTKDMADRRGALLLAQRVVDNAKETARIKNQAQEKRIQTGAGLPGIKVTRVKALSAEGRAMAGTGYFTPEGFKAPEIKTMNAGWSVRYTEEGPVFNYDPTKDPEASADDKAKKGLNATKAYDQLKKARSALAQLEGRKVSKNGVTSIGSDAAIEHAARNLEIKERQMLELAGARFVTAQEVINATPNQLDEKVEIKEQLFNLDKKDIGVYNNARAEQERLRKEIEHVRELKGQTEISQQRQAVRNVQAQLEKVQTPLRLVQEAWSRGTSTLSETAYDRRVKDLNQQIAQIKSREEELLTRLKPIELKNEERLKTLTDQYFAAKKTADTLLLGEKETPINAGRVPIAENVKDMVKTMRTLSAQSNLTDVKPLIKQNQTLKTASSDEVRLRKAAEKFAQQDRTVTMYAKGSPEYNKALKEVTGGYIKQLIGNPEYTPGTVYRLEDTPVVNPMADAEAKAIADKFSKSLPTDVKFIFAPTLREAPVKFLQALHKDGVDVEKSAVKGGVLSDGTIVVIGNQHENALDLEKTLVHEAIGHYGIDMVLGPQGMVDLTKAIRMSDGGIYGMAKALGVDDDVTKSAVAWEQRAIEAEQAGKTDHAAHIRRMGEIQSVREMLAHMQEATVNETFVQKAGRYIKVVLGALRQWLRGMGMPGLSQVSTNELYYTMFQATKRMQQEFAGTYESPTGLISLATRWATPELAAAGSVVDKAIAKDKNLYDKIKANGTGLAMETQLVDRFAGFERLAKTMDSLKGVQMLYYLRMYDQRMNFVAQSVGNGALQRVEKTRADGRKEWVIESVKGANIRNVAEILKKASPMVGSPDGASRLFTLYLAGIRAKSKGLETLGFNGKITQAELDSANRAIENTSGLKDLFDTARAEYNAYNEGLVRFAAQTHALPRAVVDKLLASKDYIPYYRQRNGVVELMIGGESPIKIGSIKEQPYLQELVGGNEPILDFMTSAVQNTNLLTDMALRNQATRNAVEELIDMDLARTTKKVMSGPNIVKFKVEPINEKDSGDRYALINTDKAGVPADILVKGMEGIPTQLPFVLRALSAPASFLRKAITASPLYAARQLFRDSLAAPLLSGADFMPVTGALKELNSATKGVLESRGITGGQVFTGGSEDLTKILRDITAGNGVFSALLSKAESFTMEADATTRRAQYNSYIKQGLSEMEATYMALESMNFSKRGASPSIHWANSLVPFFNAQIQSMSVLYKAMTGKMPFNERLKIQEKLLTRGLMIAAGTLAYTAMMQDDEAYKNATPDQKYGNWFIRIPGVEEPLRLPIPFEIGYIFKALPEALYNSMMNKHGSEEAVKAFNQILIQLIPGGTSMPTVDVGGFKMPTLLPIPQGMKPIIEASLGKSFYTQRDTMTLHEKHLLPEAQFRENTTEIAKMFGSTAGVSPIAVEEFVKGYTGTLGLAFLQAISAPFSPSGSPEKAYKRWSETPVVGGVFQPNDAGGIINNTYERMQAFTKVKASVDDYINRGEKAKAMALIQQRGTEYVMGEIAADYTKDMSALSQYEQAVRASNLTPEQKRAKLDQLRKMKITYATTMRESVDKTKPQ